MATPEPVKQAALAGEQAPSCSEPSPADLPPLPEAVTRLALPFLLRDLPMPPEVAAAMAHQDRGLSRRERGWIEEEFLLDFYFGGHFVVATRSRNGLVIHAIDLDGPEKYRALCARLESQGQETVLPFFPWPWGKPIPRFSFGE